MAGRRNLDDYKPPADPGVTTVDEVAAALALMCHRFTFKNGRDNAAAARAFFTGERRHSERTWAWVERLEHLEKQLQSEAVFTR
jgi:hypothetical protein